jgi:hypothetical protein
MQSLFFGGVEIISRQRSSSRAISALGGILVFVASFLFTAIQTNRELNVYDEGLVLTGAIRVAAGAIGHRDFYTAYGPGQFYILAGLFNAFGRTVLVERLYDAAVKAAIVSLVYVIGLPLTSFPQRPDFEAFWPSLRGERRP